MKRRFIVLVDFSDHSERLLTFSYNWALQTAAEFVVVHYASDPIPGLGEAEVLSKLKSDSMDRTLGKLKSFTQGILGNYAAIKYYTDSYNVPSAVIKLQEPDTTDYIFVGMNDKTGIEKLMMSSTALQLTYQIDSVIIALPTAMTDFHFDTLHIALKPSYALNQERFAQLLSIMQHKVKHIDFFSVLKNNADRDKTAAYLQNIAAMYETKSTVSCEILEANNTTVAIKEYMQGNKGLLVVQKGPRNIMDIFRKFFTTEIVFHAQIPIIILP